MYIVNKSSNNKCVQYFLLLLSILTYLLFVVWQLGALKDVVTGYVLKEDVSIFISLGIDVGLMLLEVQLQTKGKEGLNQYKRCKGKFYIRKVPTLLIEKKICC